MIRYVRSVLGFVGAAVLPLVVLFAAAPSGAEDRQVEYKQYPLSSSQAKSLWPDLLSGAARDEGRAGSTSAVFLAGIDSPSGRFQVTMIGDPYLCGASNECPVRIFRDEVLVFDAAACSNVAMHVLRPDAMQFVACDAVLPLAKVSR